MRARSILPALTAGLLLALFIVVGQASTASAGSQAGAVTPSLLTFTDPTSDASTAPDITNVTVTGDASTRTISFAVTAPGFEAASPDGLVRTVDVFLDTDRNGSTGAGGGIEYDLYFWNDGSGSGDFNWDIERWTGTDWQEVPASSTMHADRTGDVFTIVVSAADLGGVTSFGLYAGSFAFDSSGENVVAKDFAPDSLRWVYDIAGPTRTFMAFASPTIGKPVTVPTPLRTGKRVTVSFPVTWSPNGKTAPLTKGTMICDPSVAAKVIPHTESFKNGVARLSFVVPKTAKGKQLKVKVTIKAPSYQDKDGVWLDIATGQQGITANLVKGQSATRVVSIPIR